MKIRPFPLAFLLAFAAHRDGMAVGDEPTLVRVDPDHGEARILGRVLDAKNEPLSGVTVKAFTMYDLAAHAGPLWFPWIAPLPTARFLATSGPDGRFELAGMPQGTYTLRIETAGGRVGDPVLFATAAKDPPPIRCRVSEGLRVGGRVLGPRDEPVPGTWVVVQPSTFPYLTALGFALGARVTARTGADGTYEVAVPTSDGSGGTFTVTAVTEDGTRFTTTSAYEVVAGRIDATVRLPSREPLEGSVRGAKSGRPLGDARVLVSTADDTRHEISLLRTKPDGTFTVPVIAGPRALQVEADGIGGEGARPPAGKPVSVAVRRGGTLSGRVATESGAAVAGARVVAWVSQFSARAAITDANGAYRFDAIPRTNVTWNYDEPVTDEGMGLVVWVEAPGFGILWTFAEIPPEVEEVKQDFVARRGAVVRGRVAAGSGALYVAWIPSTIHEDDDIASLFFPMGTVCGEDGSFLLVDVPPGRIALRGDGAPVTLDLRPGETREGVVLEPRK